MSREAIVQRILSDAEAEAEAIVAQAQEKADAAVAAAEERARKAEEETDAEIARRTKAIADGRAATARLDGAKILLAEKRRVIDVIYARALESLLSLGEEDTLSLVQSLLEEYAEKGDEIVFAENFAYAEKAAEFPVVQERNLTVSSERAKIGGGFLLRGSVSDKDVSYGALLEADREEYQAQTAEQLFRIR